MTSETTLSSVITLCSMTFLQIENIFMCNVEGGCVLFIILWCLDMCLRP